MDLPFADSFPVFIVCVDNYFVRTKIFLTPRHQQKAARKIYVLKSDQELNNYV